MRNLTLRADETLLARLEGLRVQVERQHHFQATMQQLLMMLVLSRILGQDIDMIPVLATTM